MLKVNNLDGLSAAFISGGGGGTAGSVSLEDSGAISELPRSVALGSAETGRLIVIAYMNVQRFLGSIPSDTTLTLGGSAMTRVATLTSGLSGSPLTDGYKCTFYYLVVNSGTTASLSRSGGVIPGSFAVFRLSSGLTSAPAHSIGTGTTNVDVTSLSRTIDIPANGTLIACAYALTASDLTFSGASRVLNGNIAAATREVSSAVSSQTITVTRPSGGGLFFIVGSWGA